MTEAEPLAIAGRLIRRLGYQGACRLDRLPGGRNNRVYRVDIAGQCGALLLKCYFHSREDRRDRLGAEWGFATFAWARGARSLPEPLACDAEARAALFRFVPGGRPRPGTIAPSDVAQALALVREINRWRHAAAGLPAASEACFSLAEHLATIERRLQRLAAPEGEDALAAAVRAFVADEVVPAFRALAEELRRKSAACGIAAEHVLRPAGRCLSPSDFGFHNALRDDRGTLRFVDFEYAGWDDPAKLVGDFFNQVAVPVPLEHYAPFTEGLIAALGLPSTERLRFDLFRRLYAVKWTVILLNEFCRGDRMRRAYAAGPGDEHSLAGQLALARRKLGSLRDIP